ncbi:hypothetical protein NDU88_004293 [Pleurodeles waltl]|uniref:Uncharacterized protein n=1 Tax=Pleurodeles waltl TaxID=8319 RepID=A0AAV7LI44_PLEWA|nr:hypothetical protein NDU88_004293 [Pleurodeles waltl]
MLRHGQVRQLLQTARTQGPLQLGTLEIPLSDDFSRQTAERRRAFLSLCPRLRQLDVKFGLFEPARMRITKNGESRTFYDPEGLRMFLEGLQDTSQTMEATPQSSPPSQDVHGQALGASQPEAALDPDRRTATDSPIRGRDLERLTKNYDERGQVLQAVAMYTQLSDRDKSHSPLKPTKVCLRQNGLNPPLWVSVRRESRIMGYHRSTTEALQWRWPDGEMSTGYMCIPKTL